MNGIQNPNDGLTLSCLAVRVTSENLAVIPPDIDLMLSISTSVSFDTSKLKYIILVSGFTATLSLLSTKYLVPLGLPPGVGDVPPPGVVGTKVSISRLYVLEDTTAPTTEALTVTIPPNAIILSKSVPLIRTAVLFGNTFIVPLIRYSVPPLLNVSTNALSLNAARVSLSYMYIIKFPFISSCLSITTAFRA